MYVCVCVVVYACLTVSLPVGLTLTVFVRMSLRSFDCYCVYLSLCGSVCFLSCVCLSIWVVVCLSASLRDGLAVCRVTA